MAKGRNTAEFSFASEADLRAALAIVAGEGRVVGHRSESFQCRLYDTFDWRLWRRGWRLEGARDNGVDALAVRRQDGRVVEEARLASMPAFSWDFGADVLPRVAKLVEPRRLMGLADVWLDSEHLFICDAVHEPVLACSISSGRAIGADGPVRDVGWYLGLRRLKGHNKPFRQAVLAVASIPAATEAGDFHEAALRAAGMNPGGYGAKIRYAIHPGMRADSALKTICSQLLDHIVANEAGMRAQVDVEFLHDFRVAVRRTRSALSALKTVFPSEVVARFRDEFRWLQQVTGDARDLDVWLLELRNYKRDVPPFSAAALDRLASFLAARRDQAYERIVDALDSDRYATLIADWQAFLDSPCPAVAEHPDAAETIAAVAGARIWKAWRGLVRDGRAIDPDGPVEPLHELRIRGKKLRYLMAFFATLFETERVQALQPPLKALQDVLGTLNDLFVQQNSLRVFAIQMEEAGQGNVDTLLAMGRLSQVLTIREEQTRTRFVDAFADVSDKRAVKSYKQLFKPAPKQATCALAGELVQPDLVPALAPAPAE